MSLKIMSHVCEHNKTQNVNITIFVAWRDTYTQRGRGNSNTLGILMKLIDSSLPLVTYTWVTLTDFFLHISPENRHKGRV
jgi:hypothetical protein